MTTNGRLVGGRYRILRELGSGGMGTVYVAEQIPLGRRVALKIVKSGRPGPRELERFRREATALAQLKSPNIVTLYDYGEDDDGRPWMAMELVEGETLKARLTRGALVEDDARAVLVAVARGLSAAHVVGLVHRDLKPENIILEGGVPTAAKILDFGIVKREIENTDATEDADLTNEGVLVGTPGYIAPEFTMMGISDDPRSDLYALGVIAYEMVVGKAPFDEATPLATVMAHATKARPTLDGYGLSETYEALVASLIERDPKARVQTASVVVERLAEETSTTEQSRASSTSKVGRPLRRSKRLPVAAALTIVVLAGLALFLWTRRAEETRIRVGYTMGLGEWNVRSSLQSVRGYTNRMLTEYLLNDDLEPRALAAVELLDNGKTLKLVLDERTFSPHPTCFPNGRTATTEDLAASLMFYDDLLKDHGVRVLSAERAGDRILIVRLARPSFEAKRALSTVRLSPKEWFGDRPCDDPEDLVFPSGTGRFRLVSPPNEATIVLERRSGNGPDHVELKPVPDATACLSRIAEGALDHCYVAANSPLVIDEKGGAALASPWDERLPNVDLGRQELRNLNVAYLLATPRQRSSLTTAERRRALLSLVDRARVGRAFAPPRAPIDRIVPTGLYLSAREVVVSMTEAEISRALDELRNERVILKIGYSTAKSAAEAVCASLEEEQVGCEPTRVSLASLSGAVDVVDFMLVSVDDLPRTATQRIVALANFVKTFGVVDEAEVSTKVDRVRAQAKPRARLDAALEVERLLLLSGAVYPLAAKRPGGARGYVVVRESIHGLIDPVTRRAFSTTVMPASSYLDL